MCIVEQIHFCLIIIAPVTYRFYLLNVMSIVGQIIFCPILRTPTVYTFHILKFHIIIYSYFIVPYYISCTKYNDCCGTKMVFMCSIIVALFAYTFHPQSLAVVLGHRHYFLSSEQNSKFS